MGTRVAWAEASTTLAEMFERKCNAGKRGPQTRSHQWEIVLPAASFGFGIFDAMRGSTGRLLVTDPSAGVMAAPFDAAHPARTSADVTVLANVYYDVENEARAWLAVSDTRTAVYVPGNPAKTSLVWV